MKILALETATEYCSVAASAGGRMFWREEHAGNRHSELLLPMAGEVLGEAGLALADLDGIAIGAGPGSFTGLRIACGVAQGLALGAGLRIAPVGTLRALARGIGSGRVIACLDARMGEVYHAAYECTESAWLEVSAPRVCKPEDAPPLPGGGWTGCGSGFLAHGEGLARRYAGALAAVRADAFPHARDVAADGAEILSRGGGLQAQDVAPFYVRNKVALTMAERA